MNLSPRKGQASEKLERDEFHKEFQKSFIDPRFIEVKDALAQVEEIAWKNYHESGHKAPFTEKAGAGFVDPTYDLSVEWKETRNDLLMQKKNKKM